MFTERRSQRLDHNPLWAHKADCAFPSATQNEINAKDAATLLSNGVFVVSEGANMPTDPEGVNVFLDGGILYGPGQGGQRRRCGGFGAGDGTEQHALQLDPRRSGPTLAG